MRRNEKVMLWFAVLVTAFCIVSQVLCPECYVLEAVGAVLAAWSIFGAVLFVNWLIAKLNARKIKRMKNEINQQPFIYRHK